MTSGERRFAFRLEEKLEADYLCWYDVSIGEQTKHPDFVIFHPSRGLLVLEVKDWKLDTIQSIDKQNASILTGQGLKHVLNPLVQARQYMFAVTNLFERDPQLIWPSGSLKGKPSCFQVLLPKSCYSKALGSGVDIAWQSVHRQQPRNRTSLKIYSFRSR